MFARFKYFFLWLATPLQKLLQKWSRPEPEMSRDQVSAVMKRARRGDLLLSYEGGRLTSPFIPGDWDHLAVINNNRDVIEAVAPKVRFQNLEEWLFKKKGVALVRYKNKSLRGVAIVASNYVNKFVGWPYDYLFKYGNKKVYCSEIGYITYKEIDPDFMKHLAKGKEVTPNDFYLAAQKKLSHLEIIIEARN